MSKFSEGLAPASGNSQIPTQSESRVISPELSALLEELQMASSPDEAFEMIRATLATHGRLMPDKLDALSPEAPMPCKILSSTVYRQQEQGMPYVVSTYRLLSINEGDVVAIRYHAQDPSVEPAMSEVQITGTKLNEGYSYNIGISKRSYFPQSEIKWGDVIVDEFTDPEDSELLDLITTVSGNVLTMLE